MKFEINNATVQFDSIPALDNISCAVESGSSVLLTGSTGAGKTTFLKMLYAEVLPTKGEVMINNATTKSLSKKKLRELRQNMGIIFQDIKLVPSLTIYENVVTPLVIAGYSQRAFDKRCLEVLSDLGISYLREKFPHQISGGEKQLTVLARAIMHRPDCIIADEPTGNVDGETVSRIAEVLKNENARGATLIVATHDPYLMSHFNSSHKLVLHEGMLASNAATS